jgi:hypothetical protein
MAHGQRIDFLNAVGLLYNFCKGLSESPQRQFHERTMQARDVRRSWLGKHLARTRTWHDVFGMCVVESVYNAEQMARIRKWCLSMSKNCRAPYAQKMCEELVTESTPHGIRPRERHIRKIHAACGHSKCAIALCREE